MPRPVRARTSLPGHAKAAKVDSKNSEFEDEDLMVVDSSAGPSNPVQVEEETEEETSVRPPTKQKKSDKLYARREALLAKITEGTNPYSKSHNRRLKKAARPSEHLVTSLGEVENVLEEVRVAAQGRQEEEEVVLEGGKGKEKMTAKKRQRVLTDEAARLPAIMANASFAAKPWETIRLHTLNTLETLKAPARPKSNKNAQKKLK